MSTIVRTKKTPAALIAMLFAITCLSCAGGTLAVHTDFEGGSAEVVTIDPESRTVKIRPAGDFKRGWPCWWYFRVSGCEEGETLNIEVDAAGLSQAEGVALPSYWVFPDRATFSGDGATWKLSEPRTLAGKVASWKIKSSGESMWFAWGPPFTPQDSEKTVQEAARSPHAEAFELCKSNEGRSVPALRVTQDGNFSDTSREYVWITARTHAWESGSSWVAKGLADWIVSDEPQAMALRSRAIVIIVPIVDIDNTFLGNGGKGATPHDHNRDWGVEPIYAEVKAIQEMVTAHHKAGRLAFFVDFHNPGPDSKKAFCYVPSDTLITPAGKADMERFVKTAVEETTGPILLDTASKAVGPAYDKNWQKLAANWMSGLVAESDGFGICIEVAWNTPNSNTEGYTAFGRQQGLAIERFLREAE